MKLHKGDYIEIIQLRQSMRVVKLEIKLNNFIQNESDHDYILKRCGVTKGYCLSIDYPLYYTIQSPGINPIPDQEAPLSNETKVVESVPVSKLAIKVMDEIAQRYGASGFDGISKDFEFQLGHSKVVYKNFIELCMQEYASKFKNTDAVKAYAENRKVELKTEFLDNNNPFPPDYYNARIDELNHILKLIQP